MKCFFRYKKKEGKGGKYAISSKIRTHFSYRKSGSCQKPATTTNNDMSLKAREQHEPNIELGKEDEKEESEEEYYENTVFIGDSFLPFAFISFVIIIFSSGSSEVCPCGNI